MIPTLYGNSGIVTYIASLFPQKSEDKTTVCRSCLSWRASTRVESSSVGEFYSSTSWKMLAYYVIME